MFLEVVSSFFELDFTWWEKYGPDLWITEEMLRMMKSITYGEGNLKFEELTSEQKTQVKKETFPVFKAPVILFDFNEV